MYVNKYNIIKPSDSSDNIYLNNPISNQPSLAGQSELIKSKFVNVEVKNSINEIVNYESAQFKPINRSGIDLENITYIINLYDNNLNYYSQTKWSDAEFRADDIINQKNSFTKSFVRLDFFDTDENSKQRLLFFVTLYPKINISGLVDPSQEPMYFKLGNTLVNPEQNGEGFFLYYFKDEILPTVGKYVYMRATFYNAKNGRAINFMSTNQALSIEDLIKPSYGQGSVNKEYNLYTKYGLLREENGYKYLIDDILYSNNVSYTNTNSKEIVVNLNQIKVI